MCRTVVAALYAVELELPPPTSEQARPASARPPCIVRFSLLLRTLCSLTRLAPAACAPSSSCSSYVLPTSPLISASGLRTCDGRPRSAQDMSSRESLRGVPLPRGDALGDPRPHSAEPPHAAEPPCGEGICRWWRPFLAVGDVAKRTEDAVAAAVAAAAAAAVTAWELARSIGDGALACRSAESRRMQRWCNWRSDCAMCIDSARTSSSRFLAATSAARTSSPRAKWLLR